MADVASGAGVSRQTLYQEFGAKQALGAALTERRGLNTVAALRELTARPGTGIGDAVAFLLDRAGADPVLRATLTATAGPRLPPLLPAHCIRLLVTAREVLADLLAQGVPAPRPGAAGIAAEAALRLVSSQLLVPVVADARFCDDVAGLVAGYLRASSPG